MRSRTLGQDGEEIRLEMRENVSPVGGNARGNFGTNTADELLYFWVMWKGLVYSIHAYSYRTSYYTTI